VPGWGVCRSSWNRVAQPDPDRGVVSTTVSWYMKARLS
jgi:hypothetical protein